MDDFDDRSVVQKKIVGGVVYEKLETLESLHNKYRPNTGLLVNTKAELRTMIGKATRRIVVRSFSKENRQATRSFNDDGTMKVIVLKYNQPDDTENKHEHRNSLRVYQGHDSPIKKKTLQKQLQQFNFDHAQEAKVETLSLRAHSDMQVRPSARSATKVNSKQGSSGTFGFINLESNMIALNEAAPSNRKNIPSTPVLQKKGSSSSKDERTPQNRTFREVAEFNLGLIDDGKSAGMNPTKAGTSSTEQNKMKHRTSHFSSLENQAERGVGFLAAKGLESLTAKPSVVLPQQGSFAFKAGMVTDVNSPEFDLSKYKFLIHSRGYFNEKEYRKFIKEIKIDLDVVKRIPQKEPCPPKVVLVDTDRCSIGITKLNVYCSWILTKRLSTPPSRAQSRR